MKHRPSAILVITGLMVQSTVADLSSIAYAAPDPVLKARQAATREGFPGFDQLLRSIRGERKRIDGILDERPFPVDAGDYRVRGLFSRLFFDNDTRRDTLPLIEQSLAERSRRTRAFLAEDNTEVDVMIVGAGPEGAVALDELTRTNPELARNSVVIDQKDGVGGQFRDAGDLWYLNSPDRPETGSLPGPGGNLNRFIKWFSSTLFSGRNWPTAGKVAEVAQAAHYASPINVAFRTRLVTVERAGEKTRVTLELLDERTGQPVKRVQVLARAVIDTTGLGVDKETFAVDKKLRDSGVYKGFNAAIRKFGPYGDHGIQSTVGKSVAIFGAGDSGKVIAELLTRVGPEGAYKNSPSQLGGPKQIIWYVGDKELETCIDYFLTERKRYALLLGAIRSGKLLLVKGRVASVDARPDGKAEVTYDSGLEKEFSGRIRGRVFTRTQPKSGKLKTEDLMVKGPIGESAAVFDLIISTAGLKSETFSAFPTPAAAGTPDGWTVISDEIGGRQRRIARRNKEVPGYVRVGPANESLGALIDEDETVGATANTVSLFLNAPRVAKTTQRVAESLSASDPRANPRLLNFEAIPAADERRGENVSSVPGVENTLVTVDPNEGSLATNVSQPERVLKAELARLTGRMRANQELSLRFRARNGGQIGMTVERASGQPQISEAQFVDDRLLSQLLSRYYFGTVADRGRDVLAKLTVRDDRIEGSKGTLEVGITRPIRRAAEVSSKSPQGTFFLAGQVRADGRISYVDNVTAGTPTLVVSARKTDSAAEANSLYEAGVYSDKRLIGSTSVRRGAGERDFYLIADPRKSGEQFLIQIPVGARLDDYIIEIASFDGYGSNRQYFKLPIRTAKIPRPQDIDESLGQRPGDPAGERKPFIKRTDGLLSYVVSNGGKNTFIARPAGPAGFETRKITEIVAIQGLDRNRIVISVDLPDPRTDSAYVRVLANYAVNESVSAQFDQKTIQLNGETLQLELYNFPPNGMEEGARLYNFVEARELEAILPSS